MLHTKVENRAADNLRAAISCLELAASTLDETLSANWIADAEQYIADAKDDFVLKSRNRHEKRFYELEAMTGCEF